MLSPKSALPALALVAAAASLSACGGASSTASAPTNGAAGGVTRVHVTLSNAAGADVCQSDASSVPAGPVTVTIDNQSATGISEFELQQDQRIVGEKENLAPGLDPVSFTVTLDGGDYQLYCPGAQQEILPLNVTGTATQAGGGSAQAVLQRGAASYRTYVGDQVTAMVQGATTLDAAIRQGDMAAAQRDYASARIYYERIESDVAGFVLPGHSPTDNRANLDYLIDMRATNLDPSVGWHGWHAVERDLFGRGAITDQTRAYSSELLTNVKRLAALVKSITFKPEDLANGAASLLEEVQANKISGEEEAFSHLDLVDFAGDLEGAQQCFLNLEAGLKKVDPALTSTIARRFVSTNKLLDSYKSAGSLGGYVRYTPALRATDANHLSQTVQALQDPLSRLAEKVATAR